MSTFAELNLIPELQRAVDATGYTTPTPIQIEAIPHLIKGHDLLGCAQTGTGKTAAFALPILQRLASSPKQLNPREARVLILTPTRELAIQILESFKTYGVNLRMKMAVVFGGVGQGPQVKALSTGVDVLVATPGRLHDLIDQRYISLRAVDIFVLDEADRMLDMGFIDPIRKVIALLPTKRQNLFFSATMPPEIEKLASTMLTHPKRVEVTPVSSTAKMIAQSVMYVDKAKKRDLLQHLLKQKEFKRVIVFTRTKHGANKVVEVLIKANISSEAIHGNKSQSARQRALENFKSGHARVLVATDIASRGIDVDNITHVINFEIPNQPEDYVHRIGRTARAGTEGIAISLCDGDEKMFMRDIERLTGVSVTVNSNQPFHSLEVANQVVPMHGKAKSPPQRQGNRGQPRQQRQGGRPGGGGGGKPQGARSGARPQGAKSQGAGRSQGRSSGRS